MVSIPQRYGENGELAKKRKILLFADNSIPLLLIINNKTKPMTTKNIGDFGEEAAVNHLMEKGYTILERNWRLNHLEVDIIAANRDFIVFCEVKTRDYNAQLSPQDAVDSTKQRNMISAANAYVKFNKRDEEVRMDIISIVHHNCEVLEIEHIEDAFYPTLRTR